MLGSRVMCRDSWSSVGFVLRLPMQMKSSGSFPVTRERPEVVLREMLIQFRLIVEGRMSRRGERRRMVLCTVPTYLVLRTVVGTDRSCCKLHVKHRDTYLTLLHRLAGSDDMQ